MYRMSLLWIAIAAVIPLSLEASAAAELSSGTRDRPVEVEAEPFHSIRLVNSTIRVYEALIPAGEQTLFHTHRQNGAGVDLTAAQLHIEKVGADPVDLTTKPGDIFPVDLEAPFAHRVSNVGSVAYRVIVAELVQPPVDPGEENQHHGHQVEQVQHDDGGADDELRLGVDHGAGSPVASS